MTTTSPAPATELDGSFEGPAPIRGRLRRLLLWMIPANTATFIIWGSVPGVLMALQVQHIDETNKVANLALVTTIGALVAMIAQPVAGAVSDRTRSRFGRRAPWIVAGALIGGLALVGMGLANTIAQIAIAWTIVSIGYNFASAPLSAVMPDRVPRAARGTFSAIGGIGIMLGALGGQILGSAFSRNIQSGYLVLAGFSIVMLTLFAVFNKDRSSAALEREPFSLREFLSTFWVNPIAHPDYFWAFTGRFLLFTGYFSAVGYKLYILQDYIGLGEDAVGLLPTLAIANLAGILITTVIAGPLSDRLGRRKIFVFLSSVILALGLVVPLIAPTAGGMIAFSFIVGVGFGAFQSVDTALMSEVLPSAKTFGKDLGVVNIAATLPQTLAPAIAGGIVLAFGYAALFPVGMVIALLGAIAVFPIKSVR